MHHTLSDTGDYPTGIDDYTPPPCPCSSALSFSFLHVAERTMFQDHSDLFLQTPTKILQAFPHFLLVLHFLSPHNHCESKTANPLRLIHATVFRYCDHLI